MLRRTMQITREMLPSVDVLVRGMIRAGIGIGLLMCVSWLGHWAEFGGKFFLMMAAITIIGHAEGVFCAHAAAKIRIEAERLMFLGLMVAGIVVVGLRKDNR